MSFLDLWRTQQTLVLILAVCALTGYAHAGFLKRDGTDLLLDGKPLRLVSVNKFDLVLRYLKGGDDRKQAESALASAAEHGFTAIRFSGVGFYPRDMKNWPRQDAWWGAFDALVADAQRHGVRLIPVVNWNTHLFPDMAQECVLDMLLDPDSRSWQYLELYTRQLVGRYRDNDTILFWELSNELNLGADLGPMHPYGYEGLNWVDLGTSYMRLRRDNYTSDDMIVYMKRLAEVIRDVDSNHLIATGNSAPRPAAQHMRTQTDEMDWTHDSLDDLVTYLRDTNPDPMDLISIHFYSEHDNMRFGNVDALSAQALVQLKQAADRVGKPLYIGETGDKYEERPNTPFLGDVLDTAARLKIPLTLVWQWDSPGDVNDVNPTRTPAVVKLMEQANDAM
ncbi:MAG: cellulase family glycosylhydrolase [Armatimonadota bacterium]|nr:MAG: cellulase family glycosylhydrolase [Armatimonadota bacterium]